MMRHAALLLACAVTFMPLRAEALEPGSATRPPVAVSAAAPLRQALIVAPGPGGGASAADADAYDAMLRLLGYSVTTLVVETRPELEGGLRRFAAGMKPGGEVVVLLLGSLQAVGKNLYLMPTAASSDLVKHPGILATEGVTVTEALARIEAQGPKEVIAVVDSCRPTEDAEDCGQAAASLPEGVSALIAERRRGADVSVPLARLASLRSELLPLMQQPNLSFFALYSALNEKLAGTDMTLAATPSLSRNFAFLPGDFLAKLRTECNRADPATDPTSLLSTRLEGIAASCTEMARSYGFSPYFAERLAIVQEQIAFQKTMSAGCDAPASAAFLRYHPNGRLHDAIERLRTDCDKTQGEAEEREAARKAAAGLQEQAGREQAAREEAAREEERHPSTNNNGLVARGGIQPSFLCTPNLTEPVAQLICADADLATADAQLGTAYRRAYAIAPPTPRHALVVTELAWARRRNTICGIPTAGYWDINMLAPMKACLLEQTRRRTAELEG